MKTSAMLIAIVIMLHCAALGALFFIQGCGTTSRTGTPPAVAPAPAMPPTTKESVNYPPPKAAEKAPAAKHAEKQVASKEMPAAKETTEYVVRSGDSIGGIAKQYGVSRSEIADLNKLTDPNKLRVGQKLMLPGCVKIKSAPAKSAAPKAKAFESAAAPAAAPAEVKAASAATTAPTAGKEYIVQKGDSLSRIAKKCSVKIGVLRVANKLQSDKLKVGQKLIVPEASAVAAVAETAPATEAPVVTPPPVEAKPAAPVSPAAPAASAPAAAPAPAEAAPAPAVAPIPTAPPPPAVVAPAPAKPVTSSGITHIVQPNDDINSIAKLYAVTVDEIVELNQLGADRTVKVGQRLKIP